MTDASENFLYEVHRVTFTSEPGIIIEGKLFIPKDAKAKLVLFHGGGKGSAARFDFLQPALAKINIASMAINFRGRGESSGVYEESSLNNRLVDAKEAIRELQTRTPAIDPKNTGLLGISLAGDTIRLLRDFPDLKALILVGPVAVLEELTDEKPPHRALVLGRQQGTWVDSPIFSLLSDFKGPKLVIYGDREDVATPEMMQKFKEAAEANGGKYIVVPNTRHNPFIVDSENPEIRMQQEASRQKVTDLIVKFVKSNL